MTTSKSEFEETRHIDRTNWPPGPWDSEPDRIEWRDEATGLPCVIIRPNNDGHLCGYVGVPIWHMFYGKHCDDIGFDDDEYTGPYRGVTYAKHGNAHVRHTQLTNEPDRFWWLGFSCDGWGDGQPGRPIDPEFGMSLDRVQRQYRTVPQVREDCTKFAQMIINKPELRVSWQQLLTSEEVN